jgi:hypothetical protein
MSYLHDKQQKCIANLKLAKSGDARAMYEIGCFYQKNNWEKAEIFLNDALKHGNVEAATILARHYNSHSGNFTKLFDLFKRYPSNTTVRFYLLETNKFEDIYDYIMSEKIIFTEFIEKYSRIIKIYSPNSEPKYCVVCNNSKKLLQTKCSLSDHSICGDCTHIFGSCPLCEYEYDEFNHKFNDVYDQLQYNLDYA